MLRGIFITFEGGEGVGKSTQIAQLAGRIRDLGLEVVVTREPGGSAGAEAVRRVLLSGAAQPFGVGMEVLLFAAARNDHVEEVIRPALEAGKIVLCDRFMDSSRVYQGATGGLDKSFVQSVERIAIDGVVPDLTLVLDVDAQTGLRRVHQRSSHFGADAPDRFEKDDTATHESRRQAFLEIASAEPDRCKVIDASAEASVVSTAIWREVAPLLETVRQHGGRS